MESSDNELILRAQGGDRLAFEQLVYRYDRRVLGMAMNYVNSPEDAQDIYQEVFIRVHRALGNFQFKSQFSTWLFRIATNVCLSYRSKHYRDHQVPLEEATSGGQSAVGQQRLSPALVSAAEAEQRTFGSEITQQIRAALKELSPQQRVIFTLRHFEGYKLREIAGLLDCAEGTVKKHLFTATERMRRQLQALVN